MPIIKARLVTFATYVVIALGIAAIAHNPNIQFPLAQPVFAQAEFVALNMTGTKEVPPVKTTASGSALFVNNQTFIDFDLSVSDLFNATAAHIHQGKAGSNGPIVVTLYKTADTSPGLFGGFSGNITASLLEGPLKGKQLSNLVDLMTSGQAYVNVHTLKYKNGEIRDQITESSGNVTGIAS